MRIDESRVFIFQFDTTDMGGVTFPMRAQSREEAADQLQKCLMRIQSELAMEFPRVAAESTTAGTPISSIQAMSDVPDGLSGVLLERIDVLMRDLGGSELAGEAKAKTIKNWTELEFVQENYAKIVHELELVVSGAKVIAPPVKDKKK